MIESFVNVRADTMRNRLAHATVVTFLIAICATSAVGQSVPKTSDVIYGQLGLLGVAIAALVAVNSVAEARVRRIVAAELNDPKSALGLHLVNPDAHEQMRNAMFDKLDERLAGIEREISDNRKEAHSDLIAFQRDVLQPIVKQIEIAHELIGKQLDRERKIEGSKG